MHRMRKPDLAIYRIAAEGLHTAPEHILFIDDKAENIHAAQAYGMQGILYSTHAAFEEEMKARGWGDLLHPEKLTNPSPKK
jgi:FMN phosphatase YigB (HAD superfamily)